MFSPFLSFIDMPGEEMIKIYQFQKSLLVIFATCKSEIFLNVQTT